MKTRIVRIGNSQGIRIPKPLLEQTGLRNQVDIRAEQDSLVIRSAKKPRAGWEASFQELAGRGLDGPIEDFAPTLSTWDEEEWEWR